MLRLALVTMLEDIAQKARLDATRGESDISSVFGDGDQFSVDSVDITQVEEAIANVEEATATKQGAQRLINGILLVAKFAAKLS